MRTVDQHLAEVLSGVRPLAPLEMGILEARGCHLARPVVAPCPLPPFDNAACDGYAVLAGDIAGAEASRSVSLQVVDDVPAGYRATHPVTPGTAVRIMSGALMPVGADAVVSAESTDRGTSTVRVAAPVPVGANIRRTGQEVARGQVVLAEGTLVGAREVALLAAVGMPRVSVRPKPRVVVISTGTELVEPGANLSPGLIPDSNGYMLTAAAEDAGALAYRAGPVPDDQRALMDTLEDQLVRADLIVTTGGVTADTYDRVKSVLPRLGAVDFARVAMSPGMPQGHGYLGPDLVPIFTLPGSPVAASVSFEVFVRPVIRGMLGHVDVFRPLRVATLTSELSSTRGLRSYLHARVIGSDDGATVAAVPARGLLGLSQANCLIVLPEEATRAPAGVSVSVMRL